MKSILKESKATIHKMFLDTTNIHTAYPLVKLVYQNLKSYTVEKWVSSMLYKWKLLLFIKRLHSVFNVVKLITALCYMLSSPL